MILSDLDQWFLQSPTGVPVTVCHSRSPRAGRKSDIYYVTIRTGVCIKQKIPQLDALTFETTLNDQLNVPLTPCVYSCSFPPNANKFDRAAADTKVKVFEKSLTQAAILTLKKETDIIYNNTN